MENNFALTAILLLFIVGLGIFNVVTLDAVNKLRNEKETLITKQIMFQESYNESMELASDCWWLAYDHVQGFDYNPETDILLATGCFYDHDIDILWEKYSGDYEEPTENDLTPIDYSDYQYI